MLFLLTSCEKEGSGVINPDYNLPVIAAVELAHSSLNLDNDTTGSVHKNSLGNYDITLQAHGKGSALPGSHSYSGLLKIYKPGETLPFYKTSFNLYAKDADSIEFDVTLEFTVDRADIGPARLSFALQNENGEIGNIIEKSLLITRNNSRPRLSNLVAPDTLIRPASGVKLLLFAIEASDSDGYRDIESVFLKRISPSETPNILLYDDGNKEQDGDVAPGDGIFSRILSIDSTARLGDQIFLFLATDKAGSYSDSLLHTITILP